MPKTGLIRNWESASVTIPNGSSHSGSIIHAGRPVVGIQMPTAWTAASLSFDVTASPGGTLFPLFGDDGTEVAVQSAASRCIAACIALDKLSSFWAFRIRSGSSASDVDDQGGARTIRIFFQG